MYPFLPGSTTIWLLLSGVPPQGWLPNYIYQFDLADPTQKSFYISFVQQAIGEIIPNLSAAQARAKAIGHAWIMSALDQSATPVS